MSLTTEINKENGLVTHYINGELNIEDIRHATISLYSNPDFRPDMAILVDLRQGTANSLSSADIDELVAMTRSMDDRRGDGRSAILADRRANLGIGKLIGALLNDTQRKIGVYDDEQEAMNWLFHVHESNTAGIMF